MANKNIAIKNALLSTLRTTFGSTRVSNEDLGAATQTGSGTLANTNIIPGTLVIQDPDAAAQDLVDQGDGTLKSASDGGTGTINYKTGAFTYEFGAATAGANNVADYNHGSWRSMTVAENGGTFKEGNLHVAVTDNTNDDQYQVRMEIVKL